MNVSSQDYRLRLDVIDPERSGREAGDCRVRIDVRDGVNGDLREGSARGRGQSFSHACADVSPHARAKKPVTLRFEGRSDRRGQGLSGRPRGRRRRAPGGPPDEVYQLAADMGGVGFIHSAACEIVRNSALINIHMINAAAQARVPYGQ